MKSIQKILLLVGLSFVFAACSKSSHQLNLEDLEVPLESGNSTQASTDSAGGEEAPLTGDASSADKAPVALVSLRDKILATSDVSEQALDKAFAYFNKNQSIIRNKKFMTIFDIGKHSGLARFYMIDLTTGVVKAMHTSHGIGSDADHDGVATSFSNVSGSKKSSLGFMLTGEEYVGKHGGSMKLDGQESINSNVRSRAIVVHSASYVSPTLAKMGRSEGCPAVSLANIKDVVAKLKNGSLFYIYHKDYN